MITVRADGDRKAISKINTIRKKVRNKKSLHGLWATWLYKWVIQNFQTEGKKITPDGWEKLSATTIERRRKGKKRNMSDKILQDTGKLRQSFGTRFSERSAEVGSGLIYSRAHQFGYKPRKLPARPILPPKFSIIEKDIENIAERYIISERLGMS